MGRAAGRVVTGYGPPTRPGCHELSARGIDGCGHSGRRPAPDLTAHYSKIAYCVDERLMIRCPAVIVSGQALRCREYARPERVPDYDFGSLPPQIVRRASLRTATSALQT